MTDYSVSEAKDQLPRLLDRMLAGEEVVITRRGRPIARLAPAEVEAEGFVIDLDWLDARRVKPLQPTDAVATVREMRAEYRY